MYMKLSFWDVHISNHVSLERFESLLSRVHSSLIRTPISGDAIACTQYDRQTTSHVKALTSIGYRDAVHASDNIQLQDH